jgi:hypothetical protein
MPWNLHPRTQLAKSYLEILTKGPGDPIALQCPRRWGKTTFLLTEMSQVAVDAGFLCVYIDVWQNRSDVLAAINYGLQEAIDELEVPKTVIGKTLKKPVKKVAAGPMIGELRCGVSSARLGKLGGSYPS